MQLGLRLAAEPGQRARLPVSLHSGLLTRLPISRHSGLLARLPSTHTLARTEPADEKRGLVAAHKRPRFSIVKAFALTCQVFVPKYLGSSFVQLVISSLSQIEEKKLRSNICAISRDHAQFQEFMVTFGFS